MKLDLREAKKLYPYRIKNKLNAKIDNNNVTVTANTQVWVNTNNYISSQIHSPLWRKIQSIIEKD